jgi:cytochrome c553
MDFWARERLSSTRQPIYAYLWTHPEPGPEAARYGAFHSSEIPYVFGTLDTSKRPFAPVDRALAKELGTYWVNFVKTGDPMRNIAPCAACHGGIERKLGTPWLEGMPREYLAQQLTAFASGERHNDSHKQMRNVARGMTPGEISDVSEFYARQSHE